LLSTTLFGDVPEGTAGKISLLLATSFPSFQPWMWTAQAFCGGLPEQAKEKDCGVQIWFLLVLRQYNVTALRQVWLLLDLNMLGYLSKTYGGALMLPVPFFAMANCFPLSGLNKVDVY
jgi:hypothetical protein